MDPSITHAAAVHCKTTTGILNPLDNLGAAVKGFGETFIADTLSSRGGVPKTARSENHADYLISSADECIQGYRFPRFYSLLKTSGFAIYPGTVTDRDRFRIGTSGAISETDIDARLPAIAASRYWQQEDEL